MELIKNKMASTWYDVDRYNVDERVKRQCREALVSAPLNEVECNTTVAKNIGVFEPPRGCQTASQEKRSHVHAHHARNVDEVLSEKSYIDDKGPRVIHVVEDGIANNDYRKVVWTGRMQLVYMSLGPNETIDREMHDDEDQLLLVLRGDAGVTMYDTDDDMVGKTMLLRAGDTIIICYGTQHMVMAGKDGAKIMTTYSGTTHGKHTSQKVKPNAVEEKADERSMLFERAGLEFVSEVFVKK
ncbi:MAG: cupin domain-containing protein [Methylococcales bacterium]|nr:cupin domain-containing protein [Methylococcales bacterium]